VKNFFDLIIEIWIMQKLDAMNSILPFSHSEPPSLPVAVPTARLACWPER
jgi:hypothetical protein